MVEEAFDPRPGHANFARLIGRVVGDPSDTVELLRTRHFMPLLRRFRGALKCALPGLSDEDVYWRLIFIFGSLNFMILAQYIHLPDVPEQKTDSEAQVRRLVSYAAAGLRAGLPR